MVAVGIAAVDGLCCPGNRDPLAFFVVAGDATAAVVAEAAVAVQVGVSAVPARSAAGGYAVAVSGMVVAVVVLVAAERLVVACSCS